MKEASIFDEYLLVRDKGLRRRVELDVKLYEKLVILSKKYEASVNKLLNLAIIEFLKDSKVQVYQRAENERTELHNFSIRESSYKKLEKLKNRYGISVCKLINIALYNTLNK